MSRISPIIISITYDECQTEGVEARCLITNYGGWILIWEAGHHACTESGSLLLLIYYIDHIILLYVFWTPSLSCTLCMTWEGTMECYQLFESRD